MTTKILLKLDDNTYVNVNMIVDVKITDLAHLRKERGLNMQTPRQAEKDANKNWEVSVYLRSEQGYNPERYVKRFDTRSNAQDWITTYLGAFIF